MINKENPENITPPKPLSWCLIFVILTALSPSCLTLAVAYWDAPGRNVTIWAHVAWIMLPLILTVAFCDQTLVEGFVLSVIMIIVVTLVDSGISNMIPTHMFSPIVITIFSPLISAIFIKRFFGTEWLD